ncbi:molybdopterin molybdotransferase MoeA [Streptomyces sp. NPDC056202]|uniref:molybdopterin molybdotransferase MoeA n=1 Tax=Streptomyces sp. NPDC056202 TaxID=3345745 RepID=UPI0035D62A37
MPHLPRTAPVDTRIAPVAPRTDPAAVRAAPVAASALPAPPPPPAAGPPTAPARTVSWEEARARAHGAARPPAGRSVPLREAAGRTLAEDLRARHPLPAFDTAAMDGFAVAGGPGPWTVRGAVRAGAPWAGELGPGDCVEISTGACVPPGAHAVLPLEGASVSGHRVAGDVQLPGRHVRKAGEDAGAGECLAPAGTPVGPALTGLAAACGHDALTVRPRPRVAVLVTGDELDHAGVPAAGRVRDALGPLLPGLIDRLGGENVALRHVPDRPAGCLAEELDRLGGADVVVVTGSTSVGVTDRLRRALADSGARLVVDTVACRPGHPMLLAELPTARWLVGLPGNPYAALVAARTLLGPLLAGLSGQTLGPLPRMPVRGRLRAAPGLTRVVPVSWAGGHARIVEGHRAAFLRGAAVGDALAAIGPEWAEGDLAPLLLP